MKKIVIFLNGKHVDKTLKLQAQSVCFPFIKNSGLSETNIEIFAADNGFKRVLKEKIHYSKLHLFGDFDSLSETHLKKAKSSSNIVIDLLSIEKNMSDFACILDHIQNSFKTTQPFYIEIHGGLGNAQDHEYANVEEAKNFLSNSPHGGIIVFQNKLILSTLPFSLKGTKDQKFSIFCDPTLNFSISNAKYNGKISLLRPSHGLSNVIEKSPLIIEREPSPHIITLILR